MNETSKGPEAIGSSRDRLARVLVLGLLLATAWLLWSGLYKPLLLALGAFSCVLVLYLSHRMHLFDEEVYALRFVGRLPGYWAWLGGQVVKSSLDVTRAVLSPGPPISPTVVEIDAISRHPVDQATLGNSITLTPGTLTLSIEDGRVTVHALTREGAAEIQAGEMNRRVAALRGR